MVSQSQLDKNHFRLSFTDTINEGGGNANSGSAGDNSPAAMRETSPYFQFGSANSTVSPNKMMQPARSVNATEVDEKMSIGQSSQVKMENQAHDYQSTMPDYIDPSKDFEARRKLEEELEECGADFCNYKQIGAHDLENLLVQNMHDIRIVLTEYFRLRDYRKRFAEKQKNSLGGLMRAAFKKKRNVSAK